MSSFACENLDVEIILSVVMLPHKARSKDHMSFKHHEKVGMNIAISPETDLS
jgi:hypothetical protein